jgi:hypothetical protein
MRRIALPVIVAAIGAAVPLSCRALDFSQLNVRLDPRLETGALWYEFDQETALVQPMPNQPAESLSFAGFEGVKFSDVLPFIGGGLTLFLDRFFVDVSAQYAFEGEDSSSRKTNVFQEPTGTGGGGQAFTTDEVLNTEFDRIEGAVSVGYAFTEHVALFAGYKRARTDFGTLTRTGEVRGDVCGGQGPGCVTSLSGTFQDTVDLKFDYDGPFFGFSFLTDTLSLGALEGVLTGNIALAFLDGETEEQIGSGMLTTDDGMTIPLEPMPTQTLKGDATGLSAGITWRGATPIERLSYSIGVNGYTYDFSGEERANFTETLVAFKFGVAYAIDF